MKKIIEGLRTVDRDSAIALVYTAINLSVLEFWFLTSVVQGRVNAALPRAERTRAISFEAGATWSIATTIAQLIIPLLLIRFVHKRKISEYGWSLNGFTTHLKVYLGLFVFMVPFVWFASTQPGFVRSYPFVYEARTNGEMFVRWEFVYLMQFIALESFFRGYLLFTLERSMKWTAIFVMMVPYAMIHWHKPPLECFGAIIAGIALGAFSLRFRSWYGGAVLHMLVAVTMDLLSFVRNTN